MVQAHCQRLIGLIGLEVHCAAVELTQQRTRVVVAAQVFAHQPGHGGFRPVGDQFDGVDKVFLLAAQLTETIGRWQIFDFDVFACGFAPGFQGLDRCPAPFLFHRFARYYNTVAQLLLSGTYFYRTKCAKYSHQMRSIARRSCKSYATMNCSGWIAEKNPRGVFTGYHPNQQWKNMKKEEKA